MNEDLIKQGDEYAERITEFLASRQQLFTMERYKSRSIFKYNVPHLAGDIQVEIQAKPFADFFSVFATAPILVPEHRRDWFLSILTRERFSETPIRQELDFKTGAVRVGYSSMLCLEWVSKKRLAQMTDGTVAILEVLMGLLQELAQSSDTESNVEGYDDLV
jgi:hypothetical protein